MQCSTYSSPWRPGRGAEV